MGIELSEGSGQVMFVFLLYVCGVAALGVFAHRYVTRGSFVKEYFLGNRGLGPWVLALSAAALLACVILLRRVLPLIPADDGPKQTSAEKAARSC